MKERARILAFVALLLTGCETTTADVGSLNLGGAGGYVAFIPQDPQPSPQVTYFDNTGMQVTKAWSQLSNAQIMNLLSDTHAEISVGKFDAQGNLTYLVAKATGSVGTYQVVMDYCDYRTESVVDNASKPIGEGRVGVGLRLTAIVTTTSAGINLGSLFALGVAASANKLSGTMTVDSIGIRQAGNAGPILTNATIDETSIQKTLEAIAVIQSKIADTNTTLDPQLLAVRPTQPATKPSDIAQKLL